MIFTVETYDSETDDWAPVGCVILSHAASEHHVEHALAPLGLYVPRGLDSLV